jgi:hypothetical protein
MNQYTGCFFDPVPFPQISSADARRYDPDLDFPIFYFRFRSIFYPDIIVVIIYGGFHEFNLFRLFVYLASLAYRLTFMNYRPPSLYHAYRAIALEDIPAHVNDSCSFRDRIIAQFTGLPSQAVFCPRQ